MSACITVAVVHIGFAHHLIILFPKSLFVSKVLIMHKECASMVFFPLSQPYQIGKFLTVNQVEKMEMAEKAVRYGERALEADSQNFACHKWIGIIISWSSGFYGTKKKIERSFDIQEHFVVSESSCIKNHLPPVTEVES